MEKNGCRLLAKIVKLLHRVGPDEINKNKGEQNEKR